jgi:hypothetical protein
LVPCGGLNRIFALIAALEALRHPNTRSFDFGNELARESVPSAQDDGAMSETEKNAAFGRASHSAVTLRKRKPGHPPETEKNARPKRKFHGEMSAVG